jgi:DNA-binding MarR family transcriptional regulator
MKTSRQLERHFKGIANHHRLDMLFMVRRLDGATLDEICRELKLNTKTASEHTRRLVAAGLLNKKYKGTSVQHSLSPYGKKLHSLIKLFSNSQEFENSR